MIRDKKKVVIIGCGMVGMSYAYALVNQNICNELVLIDINTVRAKGEAEDLAQSLPLSPSSMKIFAGDYDDCSDADLVVICAGAPQNDGETRRDLLNKNYTILSSIVAPVVSSGFSGVFLVASNPVDIMTQVVYELSGFPSGRVIGSGTALDSVRLRYKLSEYFKINPNNVHAYVIGEHGDSGFVPWSNVYVSVTPYDDIVSVNPSAAESMNDIAIAVRDSAYEIIRAKGATYYAIGMVLARLTRCILLDENSVFTISTYLKGEYNEKGVYMGVPCVVNANGCSRILEMNLNDEEKEQFRRSADIARNMLKELDL